MVDALGPQSTTEHYYNVIHMRSTFHTYSWKEQFQAWLVFQRIFQHTSFTTWCTFATYIILLLCPYFNLAITKNSIAWDKCSSVLICDIQVYFNTKLIRNITEKSFLCFFARSINFRITLILFGKVSFSRHNLVSVQYLRYRFRWFTDSQIKVYRFIWETLRERSFEKSY